MARVSPLNNRQSSQALVKSPFMFLFNLYRSAIFSRVIAKNSHLLISDLSTQVYDSKSSVKLFISIPYLWSFFRIIRHRLYLSLYPLVQGAVDVVFLIVFVRHCQVGVTFVLKCCHVMCPVCWNLLVLDELRSRGLVHN